MSLINLHNRIFLLGCILIFGACTAGTPAIPTTSPATATAQPTVLPTREPVALQAGQSTFAFYHEGREQVVLVNGGPEQGKPSDDPLELWAWDGQVWSLLAADANGPTWRNWAAIAYDTDRDVLIIHGGLQNSNQRFDETWEWDSRTWKEFTGEGPGAREGSLMTYDSARKKTVLFGGAEGMEIKGDTWDWDGRTWTKVSETGPAPRFPGSMVYSPAQQQVLMYSGHFAAVSGDFINYDDLWAWDGTSWTEVLQEGSTPGHRTHTAMVFDPQKDDILLFGGGSGTFMNDIWAWDGSGWANVPSTGMPGRSGHSVAYDAKRDVFVFFGGIERPVQPAMSDTWEWDRTQWICVSNCQ